MGYPNMIFRSTDSISDVHFILGWLVFGIMAKTCFSELTEGQKSYDFKVRNYVGNVFLGFNDLQLGFYEYNQSW